MSTDLFGDSNESDRRVIEAITGHPLPTEWPLGALPAGCRVRVVHAVDWAGPWRQEFAGTIDAMGAPEPVQHAHAHERELKCWVAFDEAQYDSSGDGPYRKGADLGPILAARVSRDACIPRANQAAKSAGNQRNARQQLTRDDSRRGSTADHARRPAT
jgi:hypothetical protein